jgi:hypothetical protein
MNSSTKTTRSSLILRQSLLAAAIAFSFNQGASAVEFETGNGFTIDIDTTLGYNAQWRLEKQSEATKASNPILDLVSDDGNNNFDKGDMTQNQLNFSIDADIQYGDSGLFLRGRGWYDNVYDDNSLSSAKPFQKDGLDVHKSQVELLDAFFYSTIDLDWRTLNIRIGDQVVSWGESMFVTGGISSAQGPIDAVKANAPGVELKDIFMPVGQVFAEIDLTYSLSIAAYYQYDWEKSRIDAPGSYFSVLDAWGYGAVGDMTDLGLPVVENKPKDNQWGIALRYLAEELNNTEFGFYLLEYNDTLPSIRLLPPVFGPEVALTYGEGIKLYGASFGTVFGDTNISGEISYRENQPLQLNIPGAFYYGTGETIQAQVSIIHIVGDTPLADNITLFGEIGHNRARSVNSDFVSTALAIDVNDVDNALDNGQKGSIFVGRAKADYFNILPATDMSVAVTYRQDFGGTAPTAFQSVEDRKDLSLKVDFIYGNHSFGASYVAYLTDLDDIAGSGKPIELGHLHADRDYASVYYKHRF